MTPPGERNVPIRTCIGCRSRHPQTQLIRLLLGADGEIRVDRRGSGRGAWLCGVACCESARRRQAFAKAWRTPIEPDAIDRLRAELSESAD